MALSLRARFIGYLVCIHLVAAGLVGWILWQRFEAGPVGAGLVIAAEGALLLSFLLSKRLLDGLAIPFKWAETGAELMAERDFSSVLPTGQGPEADRLIEVYNRMLLELREERLRLREQDYFLERLVDASPVGIVIGDLDGHVHSLNRSARRLLLGFGPVDGLARHGSVPTTFSELPEPWRGLDWPAAGESIVVAVADGGQIRCVGGEFRDRGFPRRFFLLEELTEELRRSEKRAYEHLIRMVSHEVNNSVGAVGSLLASLLHYGNALSGEDRQDFEHAVGVSRDRLQRLQEFVDGFADVVRLPEPNRSPLELDSLLDELLTLLKPSLDEQGIQLRRCRHAAPLRISVDRHQLEQALLNILKNAAEATRETDQEPLLIVTTDEDPAGRPRLRVEDSGPGIAPEIADRLFTPFFTTKPHGCGVGLTLVQEILRRHGISFRLESTAPPARGGRFTLCFQTGAASSGARSADPT